MVKFWGPYPYRSAFHATDDAEECERALAHLADVLMVEGAHNVAAIVLETVVGTNGILVPPDGYLQGVRDLCDEHGIVMIADEVMAGFGRCGEWFAVDHWDVAPDLICFAKGVNSGYVPLGGVDHQPAHRRHVRRPPVPGRPDLLRASAGLRVGRGQHQHLQGGGHHRARPPPRHRRDRAGARRDRRRATRSIGEVRGLGVFWAIELVKDRGDPRAARAVQRGRAGGRADERARRRPASSAACGRSPTSTGCTSCRRSRRPTTRSARAWRSSTRPSSVADAHATA